MDVKHALTALALTAAMPAMATTITQTNLTSDGAITATVTDPNLKNPWGISYAPTGPFWVSDNATGLTTVYNSTGGIVPLVVTIPPAAGGTTGNPTGQVYNSTTDFVVSAGGKSGAAAFIFVTEDGTISGWNFGVSASSAIVMVDRSAKGAVYKGVALVTDKAGKHFLLATDFHNGNVDVFDATFTYVKSFRDKTLPRNYVPYNVAVLKNNIYVTYAVADKARHDSVSGPGKGAVEEIDINGTVEKSYAHGALNAPWGLSVAPPHFGKSGTDILVGNFGNGQIVTFTELLVPKGVLKAPGGKPVSIDGLWGLIPGNGGSGGDAAKLYFSAGPNDEANGLFGSLSLTP